MLECLDHSPACSPHPSMQTAVFYAVSSLLALFHAYCSCLLASSLLIHESYTHGSHTDRSSCFLSFSAAPIEILYIDHFRFLLSCFFNLPTPYRYIYNSNIAVNCYTVSFIFPSPATGKPDTNLVGRALRARADHNTTTKLREVLETLHCSDARRKYIINGLFATVRYGSICRTHLWKRLPYRR